MLWLTLATLILSDPAASPTTSAMGSIPAVPMPAVPMSPVTTQAGPAPAAPREPRLTAFQSPPSACAAVIQRIDGRLERRGPVEEGGVKLYRLFALQDAQGCPIPVIVRDVLEADRSIGRRIP